MHSLHATIHAFLTVCHIKRSGTVRDCLSRTLRGKPWPVGPRPPSAQAVTAGPSPTPPP